MNFVVEEESGRSKEGETIKKALLLEKMIKKLLLFLLIFAAFQLAINIHLLKVYEEDDVKLDSYFVSLDTDRPWMVLHIGPPKTGTTTIQKGLMLNSPILAGFDNVFYLGQSGIVSKRSGKTKYVRYTDHRTNKKGELPTYQARTLFLGEKEMLETLERYRQEKRNVVISSEHFTSKFPPSRAVGQFFERIFDRIFLRQGGPTERMIQKVPTPSEHRTRQQHIKEIPKGETESKEGRHRRRLTEEGNITVSKARDRRRARDRRKRRIQRNNDVDESARFGFNVKIVINYRHYFQWLPSFYFQSELINKLSGAQTLIEFIDEAIEGVGSEYRFDSDSTKRKPWSQIVPWGLNKNHGTLYSYLHWSSPLSLRNRIEIFDLHQQQIVINADETMQAENSKELFHNFVCQALPAAAETCSQVREANETLVERARAKSGLVSSLETGKLSDTQVFQLKSAAHDRFPELEQSKKSTKNLTTVYDVDPVNSVFQYRAKKHVVENLIRANFFDWVQHRKATASDDGHRQLCLSDESTLALKTISWNMLRHLEALVRMRDNDLQGDASKRLHDIFEAPAIHRPKYPLLFSPRKYDHEWNGYESNQQDEDWWVTIKRNHDKLFDQTVESGAYCELDLELLFADEHFVKHIFYRSEDIWKRKNAFELSQLLEL